MPARRILPQRVTLEVEEDVTLAGSRDAGQGILGQHPVGDGVLLAVLVERPGAVRGFAAGLHSSLVAQPAP
ncbi:hypothetical protein D9M69_673840 [compost metagenome]